MLDREREFYDQHCTEWNAQHPRKFVVVKEDSLAGVFDNIGDALAAGASAYGLEPFLVRKLGQPEAAVSIPALTLGLISADS